MNTSKIIRLIAIYFSRQKELDTDTKAIQQIEFVGQQKNTNGVNADGMESMFDLTILEKDKEMTLKSSLGIITLL